MADTKALQDTRFNAPKTLACLHQPAKKRSRQRCLHLFFISRLVLGCTQRHARRAMSGLSHDQPRSTSAVEEEDWAGGGGGAGRGRRMRLDQGVVSNVCSRKTKWPARHAGMHSSIFQRAMQECTALSFSALASRWGAHGAAPLCIRKTEKNEWSSRFRTQEGTQRRLQADGSAWRSST